MRVGGHYWLFVTGNYYMYMLSKPMALQPRKVGMLWKAIMTVEVAGLKWSRRWYETINLLWLALCEIRAHKNAHQKRVARVRACNYVNLKPGRIIELLLKIVTHCTEAHRHKPLLLSTWRMFYFSNSSIILTGLTASIGVTHSRQFLCALGENKAKL